MNAWRTITRIWKIAHGTDKVHWAYKGNNAIKMKIISPAYKLPNNLKPLETGFANKDTPSKNKFIGIKIIFINKFFD